MNPWRRLDIKSKLVALMIIVVVAPMPVTMLAVDGIISSRFEKTGRARIENAADTVTATLDGTLGKLVSYVELMMRDQALTDAAYYAMMAGERAMLFKELRKTFKVLRLDSLRVTDREGRVVTVGEYYAMRGEDASGYPLAGAALGDDVAGDILYTNGRYTIQAAAPLRKERIVTDDAPYDLKPKKKKVEYEVLGAIIAGIYIDKSFLKKIEKMSGARLSILRDGKVIISTLSSFTGASINAGMAKSIENAGRPVFNSHEIGGTPYLSAYLPMKNRAGNVIGTLQVSLNVSDIDTAAGATRLYLVKIMILSLLAALALAFIVAGGIVRPIRKLEEGAAKIRKGETVQPISVNTGDELESLANSFNKMAETLERNEKERARYLEELKEKNRQMLLAERHASLGRVAAHVGHEVGNPLTSISSFVQMMKKRKYDRFTEDALDTIYKHIERISNIVKQLTGLARPAPEGPKECAIHEVVEDSLKILRFDKRMQAIDVGLRDISSLPMAAANSDQLQQVFVNLILNAAEAMPGGGELSICGGLVNGGGLPSSLTRNGKKYMMVDFSDTGCGVPPDKTDQIFEPFYTSKDHGSGSGLGLALSHGIIRRFNGEITFTSTGQGSTFRVYLPAA